MTIRQLLDHATRKLAGSETARLDAELLLGHALEVTRSFLYANPDLVPPERRRHQFAELVRRRQTGEPIAYLVGHRAFWTLDLRVNPSVLIPRPETELLVEAALERLPATGLRRVADLGTGSGAIALAIASARPASEVHGTDCSPGALDIAVENAQLHGLQRVRFHLGDWDDPLEGQFDLIASNPPYVASADPHLETGDCRFEPRLALTPGTRGLEAIEAIAARSAGRLEPGGWLLLEHGYDQAAAVDDILRREGFREIVTVRDLAGRERVTIGRAGG